MAAARTKKRVSHHSSPPGATTGIKVPVKSPSTPHDRSPIKSRKMGISAQQKQALIDNLQLEITERARRLRAQYQLQAQGLRSRIEIRINRIPVALRKLKMGDLLQKYAEQEHNLAMVKPPPVPAKDTPRSSPQRPAVARKQAIPRSYKRMSTEISGDKENEVENVVPAAKRARGPQQTASRARPNQVLSPTSSNTRLTARDRPTSPIKSYLARPVSPMKAAGQTRAAATASNVLSSMVERAKATRARATRTVTATSDSSLASNGTAGAATARTRRPAATAAAKVPATRPATRTARRVSDMSETSDGSSGTVVRKASAAIKTGTTTRSTVMGTIRKGVTGGSKRMAAASKQAAAPASSNASGRVLRKRA